VRGPDAFSGCATRVTPDRSLARDVASSRALASLLRAHRRALLARIAARFARAAPGLRRAAS